MPTPSHAPAACCGTPPVCFGCTYASTPKGDHAQASTPGGTLPIPSPVTFAYRCALPVCCISGRGPRPHLHRRQLPAAARHPVATHKGGFMPSLLLQEGAIPMLPSIKGRGHASPETAARRRTSPPCRGHVHASTPRPNMPPRLHRHHCLPTCAT